MLVFIEARLAPSPITYGRLSLMSVILKVILPSGSVRSAGGTLGSYLGLPGAVSRVLGA